jgi:hypothetical protein
MGTGNLRKVAHGGASRRERESDFLFLLLAIQLKRTNRYVTAFIDSFDSRPNLATGERHKEPAPSESPAAFSDSNANFAHFVPFPDFRSFTMISSFNFTRQKDADRSAPPTLRLSQLMQMNPRKYIK